MKLKAHTNAIVVTFYSVMISMIGSGCSLDSKRDVTVSFTVPTSKSREVNSGLKSVDRIQSNSASQSAMVVGFPDTVSDFDCYALNITGDGITSIPYSGMTGCNDLGATSSLVSVSTGATLSIDVTSGPSRKITLIGVKTGYGCSADTLANLLLSNASLPSAIYKVAETTTDLFADTAVDLTNSYNASEPENALSCFDAEGPYISAVSATYSALAGGQSITIDGQNFRTGITVSIGSAACGNVSLVSSRQLTCTLPAQTTAGSFAVSVTNVDANTNTFTTNITYYSALSATSSASTSTSTTSGATSTVSSVNAGSSITVTPSGGVSPYTYSVDSAYGAISSDGVFATSATSSGTATITVTDLIGNTASLAVTVTAAATAASPSPSPSASAASSSTASPSPSPTSSTGGLTFYSYVYASASPSPIYSLSSVTSLSMHAGSGASIYVRSTADGDTVLTANTADIISFPAVWASASPSASASATYTSSTTTYTVSLTRASPTPSASSSQSSTEYAEGYVYISAPSTASSSTVTISGVQSGGATGTLALAVYPAFSATPASSSIPAGGSTTISVYGGIGTVYGSATGGTLTQTTDSSFQFTAASSGYSNGYVSISDSIGGYSYNYLTITAASLAISPTAITLAAGNSTTFSASGGTGSYTYSLYSGYGSVNTSTGAYTSSSGYSGIYTVRVIDSSSNISDAIVTVNPALSVTPSWQVIGLTDTLTVTSSGGVSPITWSIDSPAGAGSWITASGDSVIYQNSDYPESVRLRAMDALGNSTYATIHTVNRTHISGGESTCAIHLSGSVKCWGRNDSGELGYGDTVNRGDTPGEMGNSLPSVNLGTNRLGYAIASWNSDVVVAGRTCAILDTGDVKCWGENASGTASGSLGYGDTINRGTSISNSGNNIPNIDLGTNRKVLDITAGKFNSCAILDNHQVKCWGANQIGELGYGNTISKGGSPSDMGDYLSNVNLGTNRTAKSIVGGHNSRRYCAILDTDELKCWGENSNGELGYGDTVVRGVLGTRMGDFLPSISVGANRTVRSLSLGKTHSCAILDNENLKCWGSNTSGELGLGDTRIRGDDPTEMGSDLPPILLGINRSAHMVAAGVDSTCVITDDSRVKCFGRGGLLTALGYGDTVNRGGSTLTNTMNVPFVDLGSGRTARSIKNADNSVCVLLDDNSTKCWGVNNDGRLGYGDTVNRGDSTGEMGTMLPSIQLW